MIGDMISKVRKEKNMTKTELANLTDINIGHLTHIEKGERNPSHKALKNICQALDIPYQQLMYTYDKELNETQEKYNSPLDNKEIGLFFLNKKFYIRRFSLKRGKIVLKADNKSVEDISISEDDNFFIVGKVL